MAMMTLVDEVDEERRQHKRKGQGRNEVEMRERGDRKDRNIWFMEKLGWDGEL